MKLLTAMAAALGIDIPEMPRQMQWRAGTPARRPSTPADPHAAGRFMKKPLHGPGEFEPFIHIRVRNPDGKIKWVRSKAGRPLNIAGQILLTEHINRYGQVVSRT